MKVNFKGDFSIYIAMKITAWMDVHLIDITIMEEPILVFGCKITKERDRVTVEVIEDCKEEEE